MRIKNFLTYLLKLKLTHSEMQILRFFFFFLKHMEESVCPVCMCGLYAVCVCVCVVCMPCVWFVCSCVYVGFVFCLCVCVVCMSVCVYLKIFILYRSIAD